MRARPCWWCRRRPPRWRWRRAGWPPPAWAPYLLELHSHKGICKQTAVSLAEALDTPPATPTDVAGVWLDQLSAYAEAVTRVRNPLGYSLHDVLAVIAGLQDVPAVPAAGGARCP
jgi:hypothetical protein